MAILRSGHCHQGHQGNRPFSLSVIFKLSLLTATGLAIKIYISEWQAIESVATTTSKTGEPQLRIKLHSKLKAAELLIRIFEIQETELRLAELEGRLREVQIKSG